MSQYNSSNFFEMIASFFIPGYLGYANKEGRRDTDKFLRIEIAKRLDYLKEPVNEIIRQQMDDKDMHIVIDLDRIKRKLDTAANQIRFAAHGESGFFDVVQVNANDLDRLYKYDLQITEVVDHLVQKINALRSHDYLKTDCLSIINDLSVLSGRIRDREKVIMEVK